MMSVLAFRIYFLNVTDPFESVGTDWMTEWLKAANVDLELVVVKTDVLDDEGKNVRVFIKGWDQYWLEILAGGEPRFRVDSDGVGHGIPRPQLSEPAEDRLYVPPTDAPYLKKSGATMANSINDCQTCGNVSTSSEHWEHNPKGFHEFLAHPPGTVTWDALFERGRTDPW